jgi:DNA-binding FadR family transcriptional regulator
MSTEDDREKRREESPEWHRARAKSLREHGFTKMAEEHEQIAQAIERRRQQQTRYASRVGYDAGVERPH